MKHTYISICMRISKLKIFIFEIITLISENIPYVTGIYSKKEGPRKHTAIRKETKYAYIISE